MSKHSAGILAIRRVPSLQFFLVHPGGPFWAKKDEGAWTIPKGEIEGEEPLAAAIREFEEETGVRLEGEFQPLRPIVQKSGKLVSAWWVAADFDAAAIVSNTFTMEWPPKSGRQGTFPEVDRGGWFDLETARLKINEAQRSFLDEAAELSTQI